MHLDTYLCDKKFFIDPFDGQNKLFVKNLWWFVLYLIEIEELDESDVMDLFVAIWNNNIEIVTYELLFLYLYHVAKTFTYFIYYQSFFDFVFFSAFLF